MIYVIRDIHTDKFWLLEGPDGFEPEKAYEQWIEKQLGKRPHWVEQREAAEAWIYGRRQMKLGDFVYYLESLGMREVFFEEVVLGEFLLHMG